MLCQEYYVLILADLKDLAVMVIQKYSLDEFDSPEVLSLFDVIHSNKNIILKMINLIEKETGWENEKVDENMRVCFKQVIYSNSRMEKG